MTAPVPVLHIYNGSTFDQYTGLSLMVLERGMQTLLERPKTSTLTLVVEDQDGYWDPSAPAAIGYGPDTFLYVRIPDSTPTSRTHFAGRIQTYKVTYPGPGFARIEITATGMFSRLSGAAFPTSTISGVGVSDTDDLLDRIVSEAIGGGASLGTWVMSGDGAGGRATTVNATGDTLNGCHAVADAGDGWFVEEMWNDVSHPQYRFIDRNRSFQWPTFTFTEVAPSPPTSYPYDEDSWESEATNDRIRNTVTVTPNGLTAQTATDTTSVANHGIQEYSLGSWHPSEAEALVRAEDALVAFKEPSSVDVKTIRLEPDKEGNDYLWDLVARLGAESAGCLRLFDRISVERVTPFTTVTREMVVTGFRHTIQSVPDGGWIVDLFVADAEASKEALILDDNTAGILDTGRLA